MQVLDFLQTVGTSIHQQNNSVHCEIYTTAFAPKFLWILREF